MGEAMGVGVGDPVTVGDAWGAAVHAASSISNAMTAEPSDVFKGAGAVDADSLTSLRRPDGVAEPEEEGVRVTEASKDDMRAAARVDGEGCLRCRVKLGADRSANTDRLGGAAGPVPDLLPQHEVRAVIIFSFFFREVPDEDVHIALGTHR